MTWFTSAIAIWIEIRGNSSILYSDVHQSTISIFSFKKLGRNLQRFVKNTNNKNRFNQKPPLRLFSYL